MKARAFNAKPHEVRAILAGTKTQTRLILKEQPPDGTNSISTWHHPNDDRLGPHFWSWGPDPTDEMVDYIQPNWALPCPYGKPGDRLWVRETWARCEEDGQMMYRADVGSCIHADMWEQGRIEGVPRYRWRPSIFMPRWASRITLEVTGVRVERLQNISEADAVAESVTADCPIGHIPAHAKAPHTYCYAQLWESINGAGSWDKNPWVWVVEFKRV